MALGKTAAMNQPVECKQSHVASALSDAHGTSSRLEKLVEELTQRLDAVLRQEPAGAQGNGNEAPQGVRLAETIKEFTASVRGSCDRIEYILSRLEL